MRRVALVVALLAPLAGVAPGGAQTTDTADIYAHAGANALAPAAARALSLVYVPNSHDGTVTVIDPATYRVRPASVLLAKEVPWVEGAKERLVVR